MAGLRTLASPMRSIGSTVGPVGGKSQPFPREFALELGRNRFLRFNDDKTRRRFFGPVEYCNAADGSELFAEIRSPEQVRPSFFGGCGSFRCIDPSGCHGCQYDHGPAPPRVVLGQRILETRQRPAARLRQGGAQVWPWAGGGPDALERRSDVEYLAAHRSRGSRYFCRSTGDPVRSPWLGRPEAADRLDRPKRMGSGPDPRVRHPGKRRSFDHRPADQVVRDPVADRGSGARFSPSATGRYRSRQFFAQGHRQRGFEAATRSV